MLVPRPESLRGSRARLTVGYGLVPQRGSRRQEYRLRLKRLPPIRRRGWFPPFRSSTPESFRGSCAFASLRCGVKENAGFRFGRKNLRPSFLFLSKTEGEEALGRGVDSKAR